MRMWDKLHNNLCNLSHIRMGSHGRILSQHIGISAFHSINQFGTIFDAKNVNAIDRMIFIYLWLNTRNIRFSLIEEPEKTGEVIICRKSDHCSFTAGEKKYAERSIKTKLSISTNMVQEFLQPSFLFFFWASSMRFWRYFSSMIVVYGAPYLLMMLYLDWETVVFGLSYRWPLNRISLFRYRLALDLE